MTPGPSSGARPLPEQNAKGELIAACRSLGLPDPAFATESGGPGHAPWFRCTVTVAGQERGLGEGKSRREAERLASLDALRALGVLEQPGEPEAGGSGGQAGAGLPETGLPRAVSPARWPIYADVLSQALLVAHERSDDGTLPQVAQDAALLYRALMSELGHTPQEEQP